MQHPRKDRSRKLSIYEFFQMLQIEWLVADLRLRLYPKPKDKEYWKKVRDGKRNTIDEIAEKNSLSTIFTDPTMKAECERKIYRENSFPNFHYKDENNRLSQELYDLLYYYAKDADVRCIVLGENKVGKVKLYRPFDKKILIRFHDGVEENLPIDVVTRIL